MRFYSPLRYPGGKAKLSSFMKMVLEQNLLLDGYYVEPYVGGASIALDLLINEYISEIYINDIDYSIYSFWYAILNETQEFCERISKVTISIEEWKKQKEIQSNRDKFSIIDVGFSTFYLNRTNRSGILNAGVIGGINQNGKWKISARFNKENLIDRIQKIALFKNRINIYNEDAMLLTEKLKKILPSKTLFYFDPPYFHKGKGLYLNYYDYNDHEWISKIIKSLKNRFWIISYDDVPQIKELYQDFRQLCYSLNYSAYSSKSGSEVIISSDNITIPNLNNPTNTKEIRDYSKKINYYLEYNNT